MALLDSVLKAERPVKKDVPSFQVTMLHYSRLVPSEKNDYSTENITELANAIFLAGGVKQNLLARKKAPDEYELIAGHRRRLAVKYLVEELGHEEFAMVPVHVERVDDGMGEIQLILTNSSARERSDYEKMMEVDRLTELMKAMQDGTEDEKARFRQIFGTEPGISGRELRKLVAEKLGLSETKVANLQNISHNLVPELKDRFQDGSLGVSAANAAASLPEETQMELAGKEEIRLADVKEYAVSESDTEENVLDETVESDSVSELDTEKESCESEMESESVSESDTTPECLSAYGTRRRIYSPDSLIATDGCEGGHDCFSCSMDCRIRNTDRCCRLAPMGNPFVCMTMNVLESLRADMGNKCQFINHDLAFHRQGDGEADPCCRQCEELCGFRCGRSKEQVSAIADEPEEDFAEPESVSESDTEEEIPAEAVGKVPVSESDTENPVEDRYQYDRSILEEMIREEQNTLEVMSDYWKNNQPRTYMEHRMKLDAYQMLRKYHDKRQKGKKD